VESPVHKENPELKATREKKALKEIGENPVYKENREHREFYPLSFL
jgi:hypothetical protein